MKVNLILIIFNILISLKKNPFYIEVEEKNYLADRNKFLTLNQKNRNKW